MSNIYDGNMKSVATWIPMRDFAMLQHLAFVNKVSVAAYIRGIIIDAVQDEVYSVNSKKFTNTKNVKTAKRVAAV